MSDKKYEGLYTPDDLKDFDYIRDLGYPGEYPFTRGIRPNMYRGRLWTMRQFAGYGTASDTNRRFLRLLQEGETGLSLAFDYLTLYGRDSDDVDYGKGHVGEGGAAVSSLEDMRRIFRGIPLGHKDISVSMTINAPACVLLAMYYVLGMRKARGNGANLRGTVQNDILKEFHAQNELIFPIEPAMKIFVDTVEFCIKHMPNYNPVSISGYHIREKGATAAQELAFTLADGIAYAQACIERGLDVDDFAPRFSFFFDVHFHGESSFFKEIAKFRAARRMWAYIMRERFGAKNPRSWMLRTHAQTAGVSLTWQQNRNNISRVTLQALAAILGGVQSVHTNAYDEQDSLPSEEAAITALRTQQILAYESGVTNVVDPCGGSYYIECLTGEIEGEAWKHIEYIDQIGGMIKDIRRNFPNPGHYVRREIEIAADVYEYAKNTGAAVIVGVNKFQSEGEERVINRGNRQAGKIQRERLRKLRAERNLAEVEKAVADVKRAAEIGTNIMPPVISAVKVHATLGEIIDAMQEIYGQCDMPN